MKTRSFLPGSQASPSISASLDSARRISLGGPLPLRACPGGTCQEHFAPHLLSHSQPAILTPLGSQPVFCQFPNSIPIPPSSFQACLLASPMSPIPLRVPSSGSLFMDQPLSEMYHTKNISIIFALLDWADSQSAGNFWRDGNSWTR